MKRSNGTQFASILSSIAALASPCHAATMTASATPAQLKPFSYQVAHKATPANGYTIREGTVSGKLSP